MRGKLRVQPATVLAALALFVALGGSAYAASQINGSQIKNRSIPGKKLKEQTVTGTEVDVSSLPQVPSAKRATTAASIAGSISGGQVSSAVANATNAVNATNATNAQNVGGHTFADIDFSCKSTGTGNCATTGQTMLSNLDGLTLALKCPSNPNVEVDASTADNGASLGMGVVQESSDGFLEHTQGGFNSGTPESIQATSGAGQVSFSYSQTTVDGGLITTHVVSGTLTVLDNDGNCSAFGSADGFAHSGLFTVKR